MQHFLVIKGKQIVVHLVYSFLAARRLGQAKRILQAKRKKWLSDKGKNEIINESYNRVENYFADTFEIFATLICFNNFLN